MQLPGKFEIRSIRQKGEKESQNIDPEKVTKLYMKYGQVLYNAIYIWYKLKLRPPLFHGENFGLAMKNIQYIYGTN